MRDDLDAERLLDDSLATTPTATRAAVSRALARSRIGRASVWPYFCIPARSACPGRGRVNGALRACAASSSGSTGSAAITVRHFGHSELPIRIATGLPSVRPCRTPPMISISSARTPSARPGRTETAASRSRPISALVTSTPAGTPSAGRRGRGRGIHLQSASATRVSVWHERHRDRRPGNPYPASRTPTGAPGGSGLPAFQDWV